MTSPTEDAAENSGGFSLKNIVDKSPIQISAAILSIVNFAVAMDWLVLTQDQTVALNLALFNVLSLFIVSRTTNTKKLKEFTAAVEANVIQFPTPPTSPPAGDTHVHISGDAGAVGGAGGGSSGAAAA